MPTEPASRHVVVTGAAGNLGRKATAALAALGRTSVVGIDAQTGSGDIVRGDLTEYDEVWASRFRGADVVLHLAADPRPVATWTQVQRANVDVALNVLRAVEAHQVPRVVFASSNWVLGGYRFRDDALTPSTAPRPVNPYGYSKAATERDCAALHARAGVHALAMRIGWCQAGANRPGPQMAFGRWGQELWLSNDDWAQAVVAACTVPFTGFEIVNVMSANRGMRWDLTDTERVLGYRPRSQHTPHLTLRRRVEERAAWIRDRGLRPIADGLAQGARW